MSPWSFQRQRQGSVVCASCGRLVGVNDEQCFNCGRRKPGLWGLGPAIRALGPDLGFTKIVFGACIALYVVALALNPSGVVNSGILSFLSPSGRSQVLLGASGWGPIFQAGRWWTPLSAGWLHGGLLHIGFNLYWFRMLSPAVADLYGPGRSILIYLGSSVAGFGLTSLVGQYATFMPSFLVGAHITLGASAAIFGWLGAMLYYGRRTGSARMTQQMWSFALPLFVFGLLVPMVDNWAHVGGFAGGYLLARFFDPLVAERTDHLIGALVFLVVSLLAVALSVGHGLVALR